MASHTRITHNPGILWLALVLLLILSVAILLSIDPNDYWWYVQLGKDITATGTIPTVDLYSYTQTGQPFIYHSWLSAVIFWLVYQTGGLTLTTLLSSILILLYCVMVWLLAQIAGAGPRFAALVTLLVAMVTSNHWAIRPQLFSYPLFSLTLIALWQWQRGHSRWVWCLPVIMALWVNLHGTYVLVILLAGAALLGGEGDRRMLALALGASLLTALLNPRLFGTWTYIQTLLGSSSVQEVATEWQPPTPNTWQNVLFFAWVLVFPLIVWQSRQKLTWTEWLWFIGLGWLAMNGLRHIIWFATVQGILSAKLLSTSAIGRIDAPGRQGSPAANISIFVILILMPFSLLPGLREQWWPDAPPALGANTPVEAVDWLADHPELPGPIWSDISYASYMTYALPERPVWADTRLELYPRDQWEEYLAIARARYDWQAIMDKWGINLVMVDKPTLSNLSAAMQASQQWTLVYEDERTIILVREDD